MKRYTFYCSYCKKLNTRLNKNSHKKRNSKNQFCNKICSGLFRRRRVLLNCDFCKASLTKLSCKERKHNFCNQSCAASFNNKIKRKSRRSKCESMLFDLLHSRFPLLPMYPNDKTMLNGLEVDIAIPSIKLAIEWNGIVHFKPIYGQEKLLNVQTNDAQKIKIATEQDINLIVIPDLVSNKTKVEEAFSEIEKIINILTPPTGVEPVLIP